MLKIKELYLKCKESDTNFFLLILRFIYYKVLYNKAILAHQRVIIKGVKNIEQGGNLQIGVHYIGFMHKHDWTYLNIQGKLIVKEKYSIRKGCRINIGENAVVSIGTGGYINANTLLIIMHSLTIGDDCVIGWNCQFLDEDFHKIIYDEEKPGNNSIKIGNHVWIGNGVQIYKGTVIPDNCVIASNSIVKGVFTQENALIAGHPAKIVKENIRWE
jgi:acetyltransferase-like isoleucine patch superfamily enzyme